MSMSAAPEGGPEQAGNRGPARHRRRPARVLLLAAGLFLVAAVPVIAVRRAPPVSQPIAFSHKKHTVDLKLGCNFCHKYFSTGAHSGLPGAETCGICHAIPQGDTEEAAKLTEMLKAGEPLRFNKLFRLPDYVFYTHRRHVAIVGLECVTCHDGIAETERPPERPLIEINMKFCVACHEERGASTDCTSCHR